MRLAFSSVPRFSAFWFAGGCGAIVLATASGCAQNQTLVSAASSNLSPSSSVVQTEAVSVRRGCDLPAPGYASCKLLVREDAASRRVQSDGQPSGFGPQDLWSAYNLSNAVTGGSGATVAIVDAYDSPNLAADLAVYRSTYGLSACSGSCLQKVNQTGGSSLPPGNTGWGAEESLDVDMVSAICPNCNILVVEASSASFSDFGAAVAEAHKLGATTISNSYGGSEFHGEEAKSSPYNAKRPVTASGSDGGDGAEFPAVSAYVTSVGGTTLKKGGGSRGWTETAWSGSGGCSTYVKKPKFQKSVSFCGKKRSDNDVAFVADPATGVAVYDTYGYGGWQVFGGTSIGAPAIAAVYALAGNAASIENAAYGYAHTSDLYDIAPTGYDQATGNGTPDGTGAF
jgi:subtilase family serine protease